MTGTVIRRLQPPDAAAYRALMIEAYAREPEAFTSSVAERERLPVSWWAARVADRADASEWVFGAFSGQDLVGAAGLSAEQRERTLHKATLFGMYVRQAFRGRGLGRRLVEQVLAHARATGRLEVVQLTVSQSNAAAADLYARCGFVPFGLEPMAVRLGDAYLAKVHMTCRLAAPPAEGGPGA